MLRRLCTCDRLVGLEFLVNVTKIRTGRCQVQSTLSRHHRKLFRWSYKHVMQLRQCSWWCVVKSTQWRQGQPKNYNHLISISDQNASRWRLATNLSTKFDRASRKEQVSILEKTFYLALQIAGTHSFLGLFTRDKNIDQTLKNICVRKRLVNQSLKAAYFLSLCAKHHHPKQSQIKPNKK